MTLHKILKCMYNIINYLHHFFVYPTENFNLQAQSGDLIVRLQRCSLIHFLQFSKIDTDIILNLLAAFFDEGYSYSYSLDED